MRRLLIVLAAAAAIAACGDDALAPSPTPGFAERARTVAPTVPLADGDLPPGWTSSDSTQALIDQLSLSTECDIFDLGVTFPGAITVAAGDGYESIAGEQAISFAGIYSDSIAAQSAVNNTRGLVNRCGDEYKDQIRAIAEDELSRLGIDLGIFANIDVSLEERTDQLSIGDGSAAYRAQVNVSIIGSNMRFTLDVRVLRVGRVAAAMTYAVFGNVDEDEELNLAEALRANAEAGERALSTPTPIG